MRKSIKLGMSGVIAAAALTTGFVAAASPASATCPSGIFRHEEPLYGYGTCYSLENDCVNARFYYRVVISGSVGPSQAVCPLP